MRKAVKLADIAEPLGVSTVTVSKALSGQKGVSEEMRMLLFRTVSMGIFVDTVSCGTWAQRYRLCGYCAVDRFYYRPLSWIYEMSDGTWDRTSG